MKKFILICLIYSMTLQSQPESHLYNPWINMYDNSLFSTNDNFKSTYKIGTIKQWFNITGAPITYYFSGNTFIDNYKTQLGLSIIQDNSGFSNLSNLNLSYVYILNLNKKWNIKLGIAANYQFISYDFSKVITESNIDPTLISGLKTKGALDADFGVEFKRTNIKLGFISQNINSLINNQNYKLNTNFLYCNYIGHLSKYYDWNLNIKGIQYKDVIKNEFMFGLCYNDFTKNGLINNSNKIDFGLLYNTDNQAGFNIGFDINQTFHVTYFFKYSLNNKFNNFYDTHMIIITFNILNKEKCISCFDYTN